MREYVRVGVAVWVKRRNHPMRRLLFIDLQQIFVLIQNQLQCYACVQLIQALIFCAFFVEALCEI